MLGTFAFVLLAIKNPSPPFRSQPFGSPIPRPPLLHFPAGNVPTKVEERLYAGHRLPRKLLETTQRANGFIGITYDTLTLSPALHCTGLRSPVLSEEANALWLACKHISSAFSFVTSSRGDVVCLFVSLLNV